MTNFKYFVNFNTPHNSRRAIFVAMCDLLIDIPLSKITITDISKVSGVSRTHIYTLFDNINDIYNETVKHLFRICCASIPHYLKQIYEHEIITDKDMNEFVINTLTLIKSYPYHFSLMKIMPELNELPTSKMIIKIISKYIHRNGEKTNKAVEFIKLSIDTMVIVWINRGYEISIETLSKYILHILNFNY